MQFPKFISMLLSRSIFFIRCDRLNDPWEGAWTKKNRDTKWIVDAQMAAGDTREHAEIMAARWGRDLPKIVQHVRQDHAVSCWHMNDSESDAFWKIYSRMDEGIAIRSTVGNLSESLSGQCQREVFLSSICYVDYETVAIPLSNTFHSITHKRKAFEHEQEFRAIIGAPFQCPGVHAAPFRSPDGEAVPAELEKLIVEVIVSPLAPEWLLSDVRTMIGRLGFSFPCRKSDLLDPP